MDYRNKMEEIMSGKNRLSEEDRLKMDFKPDEIPPLPKGEEALKPSTKAGWETEAIIRAMISNLHNASDIYVVPAVCRKILLNSCDQSPITTPPNPWN